jgi:hypothetical protein
MNEQFHDKRGWKITIDRDFITVRDQSGELVAAYPPNAVLRSTVDPGLTDSSAQVQVTPPSDDSPMSGGWLKYDFDGRDTADCFVHAIHRAVAESSGTGDGQP